MTQQRSQFLHGEVRALGVHVEQFVIILLGDFREGNSAGDACIDEKSVESTELVLNAVSQRVDISERCCVAAYGDCGIAELLTGRVERRLRATSDQDAGSFVYKRLGRGEAHPRATTGDHDGLAVIDSHVECPFVDVG